jgi:hypothetical protein
VDEQAEAADAQLKEEFAEKARELEATFQQNMDEEQRRRFQQSLQEKRRASAESLERARAQLDWMHSIGRIVHWCATLALLTLGILPPLSCAWQRLTIEPVRDDEFAVRRRGLWSHTRGWPADSLTGIEVAAGEHIVSTGHPVYIKVHEGWRWLVRLYGTGTVFHGLPEPGTAIVQFYVDHERNQPLDVTRPPRRVRRFVKHLRQLSRVSRVNFSLIKESSNERSWFRSKGKLRTTTVSEPEVSRREYRSLDDMPSELRAEFERMQAEGERTGQPVTREFLKFRIRDADGNDRTYTSLDEMPPDVREAFERGRRMARRKRKE